MATAYVVDMSVTFENSPIQGHTRLDDKHALCSNHSPNIMV